MLEIKNLSKSFGDVTALDNLSFSFDGKVLGICGAQNSGKTVLLNIICGIVPPSEGEVLVFGENLFGDLDQTNKSIGYLLEDAPAPDDMTPYEFLKFVGKAKSISKQKLEKQINAALDITALEEVKNIYIRHLSVGQRKILGVAQALLGNPKLIVLDDPFARLTKCDTVIMKKIITTLSEIKPVIVSANDSSVISDICTEIITLASESCNSECDCETVTEPVCDEQADDQNEEKEAE